MTEMVYRLRIGDWSGDGHSQFEDVDVAISGDDVSEDALLRSYDSAVEATGVDLRDVVDDYECSRITPDVWDRLSAVWSRRTVPGGKSHGPEVCIDTGEYENYLPFTELVMMFLGYSINDFSWRYVARPTLLIGGHDAVVGNGGKNGSSFFGYGLFS